MYKKYSKKAISPVVATALLLVVAVVAVVGFQGWFQTYSSSMFTKTETQSSASIGNTQIDSVIGNSLYFKNGRTENLTINSVKINGVDCNLSVNATVGISELNITNCMINLTTSTPEVVVYTSSGVYSKKIYVKSVTSTGEVVITPALNCSALGLAGGTWITVPGNSALGTSDFCVMKYDAKNVAGVATSQAANTPWVNINQTDSRIKCTALGSKYHLITNAEWTTIARNAESVGTNWNTSVVGSGFMFSGHNDNGPASALNATTNDSDGYYGTLDSLSSCDGSYTSFVVGDDTISGRACAGQRRILYLNNSEIIWDLSGNIWKWNNDTCSQGDPWYTTAGWREWTHSDVNGPEKTLAGPIGNYDALNSIGVYSGCTVTGNGFFRGGYWNYGAYAGAFHLYLALDPTFTGGFAGFRCSYTP